MKIILHRLRGENVLTYGAFDIMLDSDVVSQLVGKNGSGKSSIPTILEEVLYNNNSRGVKKAKLVNRRTADKTWWGEISFSVGIDSYVVHKVVKSTAKVTLSKNGEDISGHTATQTYAKIKEVLGGLDFPTFSKLVYQSMESSLDFLKATDAGRKKFLTSFLGLEKYGVVEAELKTTNKELGEVLVGREDELTRVEAWVSKNATLKLLDVDLSMPVVPDYTTEIADLTAKIDGIKAHNIEVGIRNKARTAAKKRVDLLVTEQKALQKLVDNEPEKPTSVYDSNKKVTCQGIVTTLNTQMLSAKTKYKEYRDVAENLVCGTCGHDLDIAEATVLREKYKAEFMQLRGTKLEHEVVLELLTEEASIHTKFTTWERKLKAQVEKLEAFGDVKELVDTETETVLTYTEQTTLVASYKETISSAEIKVQEVKVAIAKAEKSNEIFRERERELAGHKESITTLTNEIANIIQEQSYLSVLLKAFSNKGIVAYKIESSIKIFEELINKYLGDFTDGKFALVFKLAGIKLQVIIYDEGEETDMPSLSSGEQSKVNISTLLAIRSLMGAVSQVNLNTLFLDEVVSVLDQEALDTLIDILLKEYELNTFVVSHEYKNPLTRTLLVQRQGLISTIQTA
jgi:DNA repair exonuclease SbcCD ATPase subunit